MRLKLVKSLLFLMSWKILKRKMRVAEQPLPNWKNRSEKEKQPKLEETHLNNFFKRWSIRLKRLEFYELWYEGPRPRQSAPEWKSILQDVKKQQFSSKENCCFLLCSILFLY